MGTEGQNQPNQAVPVNAPTARCLRSALPRNRVAITIFCLVFAEWVLFELIRVPYRPPQDMLTFLGTEKYAVMALMMGVAVVGAMLLVWWSLRSSWSKRDLAIIAALLAILTVAGTLVIFHPAWSVTPLQMLLR